MKKRVPIIILAVLILIISVYAVYYAANKSEYDKAVKVVNKIGEIDNIKLRYKLTKRKSHIYPTPLYIYADGKIVKFNKDQNIDPSNLVGDGGFDKKDNEVTFNIKNVEYTLNLKNGIMLGKKDEAGKLQMKRLDEGYKLKNIEDNLLFTCTYLEGENLLLQLSSGQTTYLVNILDEKIVELVELKVKDGFHISEFSLHI
ncbi:MAG: hypothetical protein RR594_07020 [Clostridia bacterium]